MKFFSSGENVHVTPFNVMLYIEIIEQRTNDLMNVVFHLQHLAPIGESEEVTVQLRDLNRSHHPTIEKMIPSHPCPTSSV